jgi:formate/nitrite transporter FocA (FNT family)
MKSVLAGISIAIGAYINLKLGGIAGAIFFAVGLYLVCNFQLNLYTGKVGYSGIINNLPILCGNIVGSILLYLYPTENAQILILNKLNIPLYITFINAVICGVLIYAAVEAFKRHKDYMIAICVPGFILFGAEHCIADICYIASAHMISLDILLFILIVILGNSIGSLLFRICTEEDKLDAICWYYKK